MKTYDDPKGMFEDDEIAQRFWSNFKEYIKLELGKGARMFSLLVLEDGTFCLSTDTHAEKKTLIDLIGHIHPSAGVEKGWSTYVGGMADTGSWDKWKMLDVPIKELREFYVEQTKPSEPYIPNGKTSEENMLDFMKERELKMWFKEEENK